jgi:hypothetical protein
MRLYNLEMLLLANLLFRSQAFYPIELQMLDIFIKKLALFGESL